MALVAHVTSVASGPPVSEIRLDGERGTLRMDLSNQRLMFSNAGSQDEIEIPPDLGTARGWQVEADFVASIRDGRPAGLTTFGEGVRYMTFTELAHRSWNAGGIRQRWES
jgi:predicted dehydrogenase